MEDEELIALFFSRSQQAIPALSAKYGRVCQKLAENILNNPQDAEECVNDAYLGLWRRIPPERPQPLLSYLCQVVRNLALKRYHRNTAQKRNSRWDMALEELADCIPAPETADSLCMAKELAASINRFLSRQDRESRMMFVRRYWCGDEVSRIAALLQVSPGQVSVRLSRTRKKLKSWLKKEGLWL